MSYRANLGLIAGIIILVWVVIMTNNNDTSKINNLSYALKAHKYAINHGITKSKLLVFVDFTKPSTEKRLYVIDTTDNSVVMNTWVAHGTNTGQVYAKNFSNVPESHKSSLGVMLTMNPYSGKYKNSLKLKGLEVGFNDKVYSRAIVMHQSNYIGNGKTGRSWGCFSIPTDISKKLIALIKNGVLLVAYYPDSKWLKTSKFLNDG